VFGGWNVSEFAVQASVVLLADVFDGGHLQVIESVPRFLVAHEFGLVF
jgi:hypothetical protein